MLRAVALKHLQVMSLPVSDQDRAKAFYVDTLGFSLVSDTEIGPLRWVQVRPGDGQASITLVNWFASMPAGSTKGTVIESDDLDGDISALAARGVQFDCDVQQAPWGRYVTFDDPDGNGLILQSTVAPS
jgi:catechol 2,3-dioxygenase-like lactoylglutathione lyase family enzyme